VLDKDKSIDMLSHVNNLKGERDAPLVHRLPSIDDASDANKAHVDGNTEAAVAVFTALGHHEKAIRVLASDVRQERAAEQADAISESTVWLALGDELTDADCANGAAQQYMKVPSDTLEADKNDDTERYVQISRLVLEGKVHVGYALVCYLRLANEKLQARRKTNSGLHWEHYRGEAAWNSGGKGKIKDEEAERVRGTWGIRDADQEVDRAYLRITQEKPLRG